MPTPIEHVIALDPGGRSGWASARMSLDRLELTGTGVLRQDAMARWLAGVQGVYYIERPRIHSPFLHESEPGQAPLKLRRRTFDVIVGESWRPRRKDGKMDWIEGDPLLSAQHVGQIRFIADLSGARYVEQPPSNKEMYTASMPLALLDMDSDSNEQHDKDARMHIWGYFKDNWFSATGEPEIVIP
jgi:hypothetical protein